MENKLIIKINKLNSENEQLASQLSELESRKLYFNKVQEMLNQIYSSKAWRFYKVINQLTKLQDRFLIKIKELIPIKYRKRISGFITKYTKSVKSEINNIVYDEWRSSDEIRKNDSFDILIFSIISFNYRIQRPQHLAMELAKRGHRVFYIENEFNPSFLIKNGYSPIKVKKKIDNLYLVTLSASKNLFIYNDKVSDKDKKIMGGSIKTLIKESKIINPVVKIDHPFWSQILNVISMPVIYDCMDEHKGFAESGLNTQKFEDELFVQSRLVLTSSKILKEKVSSKNVKSILKLENACEYEHFFKASRKYSKTPNELLKIKKPIIGYYGAIAEWFDVNLVKKLSEEFRTSSIVLIGRVNNSEVEELATRSSNIYLLGEKNYEDLPEYLQEFDVCIIPFIINDLIKATSPVKAFEYMASGKPIVTTNIPELKPYNNEVYLSRSHKDFIANIKKALNENSDSKIKTRQWVAKRNTWEERGGILEKNIKDILFPKVSVIILTYNNPLITRDCIESLYRRSFYPNFETIIVDNASDNPTLKELTQLNYKYKFKLIKNKENLGFAEGNNIGMKNANGKYLILLNNDTKVTPGWISRLLYHISKDNVGFVGPVTNNIGNEAKVYFKYNILDNKDLEKAAMEYTSSHWGSVLKLSRIAAFCWIMKKSLYNEVGEFDKRFGKALFEDDDYCYRVTQKGYEILCAEDVFIHHWGGITSKWQSNEYNKLLEENKNKFEDKWKIKWTPHRYRKVNFFK